MKKFALFFLIVALPVALLFGRDMSEQQFGDQPTHKRGWACVALWDNTGIVGGANSNICANDNSGYPSVGDQGNYYVLFGQDMQICRVDAVLTKQGGSIGGITHYAEIWDFGASDPATTTLPANPITNGTSTGVAGDDGWSATIVTFLFPNHPSVFKSSTAHRQKISLSTHTTDGLNYASVGTNNAAQGNGRTDIYKLGDKSHGTQSQAGWKIAVYGWQ